MCHLRDEEGDGAVGQLHEEVDEQPTATKDQNSTEADLHAASGSVMRRIHSACLPWSSAAFVSFNTSVQNAPGL